MATYMKVVKLPCVPELFVDFYVFMVGDHRKLLYYKVNKNNTHNNFEVS